MGVGLGWVRLHRLWLKPRGYQRTKSIKGTQDEVARKGCFPLIRIYSLKNIWSVGILLAAHNPNSPPWAWLALAIFVGGIAWFTRKDMVLSQVVATLIFLHRFY
jgi:hypothetical protein